MSDVSELKERAIAVDKSRRLANRARDYERAAYYRGQYDAFIQAIRICDANAMQEDQHSHEVP